MRQRRHPSQRRACDEGRFGCSDCIDCSFDNMCRLLSEKIREAVGENEKSTELQRRPTNGCF